MSCRDPEVAPTDARATAARARTDAGTPRRREDRPVARAPGRASAGSNGSDESRARTGEESRRAFLTDATAPSHRGTDARPGREPREAGPWHRLSIPSPLRAESRPESALDGASRP